MVLAASEPPASSIQHCAFYDRPTRKRASAENFAGAACVTGLSRAFRARRSDRGFLRGDPGLLFPSCLLFLPCPRRSPLLLCNDDALEMTVCVYSSAFVSVDTAALWQKFVNKSLLTADSRGIGEVNPEDLVTAIRVFPRAFVTKGKFRSRAGTRIKARRRRALNKITRHFGARADVQRLSVAFSRKFRDGTASPERLYGH